MINREYLKKEIKKFTNEEKIIHACKKLSQECGIDYHTIYRFTKSTVPNEESLIKILKTLRPDLNVLFNI